MHTALAPAKLQISILMIIRATVIIVISLNGCRTPFFLLETRLRWCCRIRLLFRWRNGFTAMFRVCLQRERQPGRRVHLPCYTRLRNAFAFDSPLRLTYDSAEL